jgi:hypothetical protein
VLKQLAAYTKWLLRSNNCEVVTRAYKQACHLLVELHSIAKCLKPDIEELGAGIREAAAPDAPPLLIDVEPRLLIDNRQPDASFTEHGHLKRLRDTGLHVQMVNADAQMRSEQRT